MLHTFLILDGHPTAFAPTIRNDKISAEAKADQLPPYPLWSCMVQSSLEFCRMGWDLGKGFIGVIIADKNPIVLNNLNQKSINDLQQQFVNIQPRNIHNTDRLQLSIEVALNEFMRQPLIGKHRRCHLILQVVVKGPEIQPFEFQNNENEPGKDLRSMLYKATEKIKGLDHVHVDVLRLFPYSNKLPENIINKQVPNKATLSIHNIPNGHNDLRIAMANFAQSSYNVGILDVSNVPMKSSEHTQSTHIISLYYKLDGSHLINNDKKSTLIHDPNYSNSKQLQLVYLKRSKRTIQDSEWCTCRHIVSPAKMRDLPTDVYIDMTMKGSISYLMKHGDTQDSRWSHILMAENNTLHLYCLNNELQTHFSKLVEDSQELVEVKPEGLKKNKPMTNNVLRTQEFIDSLIKPNLYTDIASFTRTVNTNPNYNLIPINPTRYAYHFPITTKTICTTPKSIENASRPKKTAVDNKTGPVKVEDNKPAVVDMDIDQAWNQVQRYEDMTLREREDAAQGMVLDSKTPISVGLKVNSSFRGRRNTPKQPVQQQVSSRYPDPSLAVPYLNAVPPTLDEKASEEKEELKRLGEPGNLLWLYWMNDKLKQRSDQDEDTDIDAVLTHKKAKKEFESRVAQPGEKGETV